MRDNLLKNYYLFFEGIPLPVYYGCFYAMGDKKDKNDSDELWDEFDYVRGLKGGKRDPEGEYYNRYRQQYIEHLRLLFNNVMRDFPKVRRGVFTIPSSEKAKINIITRLTREVLAANPKPFSDLTSMLFRARDKMKSSSGGARTIQASKSTLAINPKTNLSQYDVLVVIDDVVTTGASFNAVDEMLYEAGFRGEIINYAFGHTFNSEGAQYVLSDAKGELTFPSLRKKGKRNNAFVEAVIFDFDQTLIHGSYSTTNRMKPDPSAGQLYDGMEKVIELEVPFTIVSNKSRRLLSDSLSEHNVLRTLYPHKPDILRSAPSLPDGVFTAPMDKSGDYTIHYYKPSIRGIEKALHWLEHEQEAVSQDGCIVGIGNTYEDILAYNVAGLESVLALWGVPTELHAYATQNWGADHVFSTVDSFEEWLRENSQRPNYYKLGLQIEESDKRQACVYYEKALKFGIKAGSAAFKIAYLTDGEDPERAKKLYQIAIEAGDEYAATNNLALLVQKSDPQRAINLFERAIAAGNEEIAPRNLALLLRKDDPERAVELLKIAANNGETSRLAKDLKPLIEEGIGSAIALYEDKIVSRDGKKAYDLGLLLAHSKPEKAKDLFELAIEAGDEYGATYSLAKLLSDTDVQRAKELYERSIAAGDEKYSTSELGVLLHFDDPDKAATLYERAIHAGETYYSTRNLALLLKGKDSERAIELFGKAAEAGNTKNLANDLDSLIREGYISAIELYENKIVHEDETKAFNLAEIIKAQYPEKAKRLYKMAINAGNERYATTNLALMIQDENSDYAEELFRRAIAVGDTESAPLCLGRLIEEEKPEEAEGLYRGVIEKHSDVNAMNLLGILVARRDVEEGKKILQQGIDAGDEYYASINLTHLLIASDKKKALGLYKSTLKFNDPETLLGLAFLLRKDDPDKATEYLAQIPDTANVEEALTFFLNLVALADRETALKAGRYFGKQGYEIANRFVLKQQLGIAYDSKANTVEFGAINGDGEPITWHIIQQKKKRILLLAERSLATTHFAEAAEVIEWEKTFARRWLNDTFTMEVFCEEDIRRIYVEEGTDDLVFCLTPKEYEELKADEATRHVLPCKDSRTRLKTTWWLKPVDNETMSAPYVKDNGSIGWSLPHLKRGIRPALWLDIDQ